MIGQPSAQSDLVRRAIQALAPDPDRRDGVVRSLLLLAGMVALGDLMDLVESMEKQAGPLRDRLLNERFGQVSRG